MSVNYLATVLLSSLSDRLNEVFSKRGSVEAVEPLSGGSYNSVLEIRLANGERFVAKIAPSDDAPHLAYEEDLLRTEADYDTEALAAGASVPEVFALVDELLPGRSALILSRLPGSTLLQLAQDNAGPSTTFYPNLGAMIAGVHERHRTGFGYPHRSGRFWANSWPDAFKAMWLALLEDAASYRVELPVRPTRLARLAARTREVLAAVETPSLVHFDLWAGNLMVDCSSGELIGVIDAERAMHADPVFELPSVMLSASASQLAAFLAAYRAASGGLPDEPTVPVRLALYRLYLYLVMLIEAAPRNYSRDVAARNLQRCTDEIPPLVAFLEDPTARVH